MTIDALDSINGIGNHEQRSSTISGQWVCHVVVANRQACMTCTGERTEVTVGHDQMRCRKKWRRAYGSGSVALNPITDLEANWVGDDKMAASTYVKFKNSLYIHTYLL